MAGPLDEAVANIAMEHSALLVRPMVQLGSSDEEWGVVWRWRRGVPTRGSCSFGLPAIGESLGQVVAWNHWRYL